MNNKRKKIGNIIQALQRDLAAIGAHAAVGFIKNSGGMIDLVYDDPSKNVRDAITYMGFAKTSITNLKALLPDLKAKGQAPLPETEKVLDLVLSDIEKDIKTAEKVNTTGWASVEALLERTRGSKNGLENLLSKGMIDTELDDNLDEIIEHLSDAIDELENAMAWIKEKGLSTSAVPLGKEEKVTSKITHDQVRARYKEYAKKFNDKYRELKTSKDDARIDKFKALYDCEEVKELSALDKKINSADFKDFDPEKVSGLIDSFLKKLKDV